MKTSFTCLVLTLAALAGLVQTINATVAFTVTPSSASNTYNGTITFQVTGLTNKETVVVQKFLDANTNGVIDDGDLLWQQFTLTDGTNFVIHGVTNVNVPGDTDGTANGTITAKLYLQPDFSQAIAGKYLFKLSSPGDHFTPITNSFAVTNFPYAQKFAGTVVSNGVTVPNAVVVLFQGSGNNLVNGNLNPIGGVVADNSGNYIMPAATGTYLLTAFKSNFVADSTLAGNLVLNSSATITTNLSLIAATQSISGKIADAGNSSLGLPGLLVPVLTLDGLLAVSFTDTNGNFTAPVTSDQWQVQSVSADPAFHGYVGFQNGTGVDTTTGNVAGVIISLPKATALFYGTVKDALGNPLPGMDVNAHDSPFNNDGLYQADGFTDTNGYYVAAVVGGLGSNDPWQVQIDNSHSYPNYIFSQPFFDQNGGTNMTVGKVVLANITAILATNHISGNVQANGTNIVNVGVYAYATISGVDYNVYADTDNNGNYSFNVANGNWTVGVNQNGGDDSLDNILGGGNYQPPDEQNVNISNNNGTANFSIQTCDGVQIITSSPLPDAQQGNYYYTILQASACNNNFTWSVNDPADFPYGLGLDFDSDGEIFGNPTGGGTFNFSVHVDDNNGHTADANMSLTILPAASPLIITNSSFPNGNVGAYYATQLGATGGLPPYSWTLTKSNPPPGLTLNSSGLISGTPTTNGLFSFTVQATDSNSTVTNKILGIIVNPKPVLGVATWLTNRFQMRLYGASNQGYTVQMSTNLVAASNWVTLFTTNNTVTNSYFLTDPNATNKQRFYRVLIGP